MPNNRRLAIAYAAPYVAYVGVASIPEDWLSLEANYALRIVLAGAATAWAWRQYCALRGPESAARSALIGALVGLVGTAVWVVLKTPFVLPGGDAPSEAAFALRLLASTALVPVFEELLMRGYVLRLTLQYEQARDAGAKDAFEEAFDRRSVNDVAAGAATPLAVGISTAVFTVGHGGIEWAAALAYGFLMAGLWIKRRDLLSCVVAHATTNFTLALYVRATGHWALW